MKGIFLGRQIKDLKGRSQRITRSQTAAQAIAAITSKYGGVSDNEKYYHIGKGVWRKWSLANDSTRTGRLAGSREEWGEQPHKLDWQGIDTKKSASGKKRNFSMSRLKQARPLNRTNKITPRLPRTNIKQTLVKSDSKNHLESIKLIKGYTYSNVKKLVSEPKLNQKQLVILRDIERMFILRDQHSMEFLAKHGFLANVEDPYATGVVPKDIMLQSKISYRIDNPVMLPHQKPKSI
jgi:hypothetical protein